MRRPVVVATLSAALLLAAAAPALWLELGPGTNKGIPQDLESTKGLDVLAAAVGDGAVAPTDLAIDTGAPGGSDRTDVQAALESLTAGLEADSEVARVDFGQGPQFVDTSGRSRTSCSSARSAACSCR